MRIPWFWILPFCLLGAAMCVDEFWFHRRRILPRWERIGHPIDTLGLMACVGVTLFSPPARPNLILYAALAVLSSLLVTKDEFVHARECRPMEHWLHAVLFMLHPVNLLATALLWVRGEAFWALEVQMAILAAFGVYQTLYWNLPWAR